MIIQKVVMVCNLKKKLNMEKNCTTKFYSLKTLILDQVGFSFQFTFKHKLIEFHSVAGNFIISDCKDDGFEDDKSETDQQTDPFIFKKVKIS